MTSVRPFKSLLRSDSATFCLISPEDIVIAVVGSTGSGRSSFIAHSTQEKSLIIGHGMSSCTSRVSIHTMQVLGRTVHLVDTPGFDDSERNDEDTFQELAYWLVEAYERGIRLSGIVLLHRITDPRLYGSAQRMLNVYKAMCGSESFSGIVVATTMWDDLVDDDFERAQTRHEQLRDGIFRDIEIHRGYICRLLSTSIDSPRIVRHIVEKNMRLTLALQTELVDQNLNLEITAAGRMLNAELLQSLRSKQDLREEVNGRTKNDLKSIVGRRLRQEPGALVWSAETYRSCADRLQGLERYVLQTPVLVPDTKDTRLRENALPALPTKGVEPTNSVSISTASPKPNLMSVMDTMLITPHNRALLLELEEMRREYERITRKEQHRLKKRQYAAHRRGSAAFGIIGTGLAVGQIVATMACNVM